MVKSKKDPYREVKTLDYQKMCPKFEAGAQLLSKKWTGLIIRVLMGGPKRFKEVKELEEAGICTRHVFPDIPVRIEYRLTEKGKQLEPVIQSIQKWSDRWM